MTHKSDWNLLYQQPRTLSRATASGYGTALAHGVGIRLGQGDVLDRTQGAAQ